MKKEKLMNHTHQFHLIGDTLHVTPPLTGEEDDLLGLSIQKWETIVALLEDGKYVRWCGGNRTCALCRRYHADDCNDCPIPPATGYRGCSITPYDDFECAHTIEGALIAAKAEVKFLKSLRTEET